MRATEEAAFWLYSAKDWIDLKPTLFLWRANCFSRITSTGSWKARWTGAKRCACTLTYH